MGKLTEKEISTMLSKLRLTLDTASDIALENYQFLEELIEDYDSQNEALKASCLDEDIDFDSFIDLAEAAIQWHKHALSLLKALKRNKLPLKQCIQIYNAERE
ncbi:hypothetical protein ACIRXL_11900 [Avibacterium paragallinarum]|uniref:hypothetical protein n=1 Tax=Avibacterium paragallinarum TaxID=728 RepID=UPI00397AEDAF